MGCASCKFWGGTEFDYLGDCTNPDVLSTRTPFDGWCVLHTLRASPTPQVDMQSNARGVYSTTHAPVITPLVSTIACCFCGSMPVVMWTYSSGALAHYQCKVCFKTWT